MLKRCLTGQRMPGENGTLAGSRYRMQTSYEKRYQYLKEKVEGVKRGIKETDGLAGGDE